MTSSTTASTNRAIGILGFRITEMGGDTWSDADIQDGKNDPPATSLRLKVDVDIPEVHREADDIFRFMFDARVAIVHKGEPTGPCHALTTEQRATLRSKLRNFTQLEGDSDPIRPAYLLDSVRERGTAKPEFRDVRKLLFISALSRVGSIAFDQNQGPEAFVVSYLDEKLLDPNHVHGPETFVLSYLDKKILEDMVLEMFSHWEEKWLSEQGLQSLKDMPINSKHTDEGSSNAGTMPSSEAFAVVVVGFELRIRLDV